jgi:hypothetical protein
MSSDNITVWISIYKSAFAGKSWSSVLEVQNKDIFEAPNLAIYDRTHSETGRDNDGDQLFDLMHVSTGLDVIYPGEYTMQAVLLPTGLRSQEDTGSFTDNLNRLLSVKKAAKDTWTGDLRQGDAVAEFYFDGRLINAWGHDGTFDLHVFWTGPAPFIGYYYKVTTIEFKANDFEHPVPPLEFAQSHSDSGVSKVGGDLYDGLKVTYNVYVNTPGTYTAFAVLKHDGKDVAYARTEVELEAGSEMIEMVFPGHSIALSRIHGTFDVVVWVQGAGYEWNDTTLVAPMKATHTTTSYSWESFTPPKFELGPKDPQPVEDLTFILLKTGILSVRIDRNKPDLTFYMAEDEGRTALFKVLYTRLLAFEDANGDGAPQGSEVVYTSALLSYNWEMTQVSLVEDADTGRLASFSLSTTVDLVEHNINAVDAARPLSTVKDFAKVTLEFSMASKDTNHTDNVGSYTILGGAELKVDVHIDVLTPVDGIDFLTVEQILRDDRDKYRPTLSGQPDDAATGEVSPIQASAELKQRVDFRERASRPAFYSWVKKAEVTKMDGAHEVADVQAAFMVSDGHMLLYLSYPYDVNTTYIYHDPSLGIYEGGLPEIPEEWKAIFDPLLFGVAALAAVAVVSALRARPRRDEEDELEVEDEVIDVQKRPPPPPPETEKTPPEDDGIPQLPEEPIETNGSTILPQPPPSELAVLREKEGWVEWE